MKTKTGKSLFTLLLIVLMLVIMPLSASASVEDIPYDQKVVDGIFKDLGFSTWGSNYFGVSMTSPDGENVPDRVAFLYMEFSGKMDSYRQGDYTVIQYDEYIQAVDDTFVNHSDMKDYLIKDGYYDEETGLITYFLGGWGDAVDWIPLTYSNINGYYYITGVFVDYTYSSTDGMTENVDYIVKTAPDGTESRGVITDEIILTLVEGKNGPKILEYRNYLGYHVIDGVLYQKNESKVFNRLDIVSENASVKQDESSENYTSGFYGVDGTWNPMDNTLVYRIDANDGYELTSVTLTDDKGTVTLTPENGNLYRVSPEGPATLTVKTAEQLKQPAKPYKITNTVSGVHVYWEDIAGVPKYGLWRSETGKNGTYKWIANPTTYHFTDTKVESGKTYYYKVTSMNTKTNKHSAMSEAIGITYVSTPDITLRVNRAAGIGLRWDKIDGAKGYAIYRKSYYGNDAWVRVATISDLNTLSWDDTSVKNNNGEVYKYTIRALAGSDLKTLSGCRNAGRTMVRLTNRTLNSATKASSTSIKCKWSTTSQATGYEVRFMVGDKVYKTYTIGDKNMSSKTFTGLAKGQTYKIQVRTYKKVDGVGSFYSAWSTAKNVKL